MRTCVVCGSAVRTISEFDDVECTVDPDHGYDDLVPPPVLIEVTDDPRDDGTWQNGESYQGRWA